MKLADWFRKLLPIIGLWPRLVRLEQAAQNLLRVARNDPDLRASAEAFRVEWDAFRASIGLRGGG